MPAEDVNGEKPAAAVDDAVAPESSPTEIAAATPEETAKTCCICGLDVSQKKRHRDRSGRYWCEHCHGFIPSSEKLPGMEPCPDCGRETRPNQMVEQAGIKVCPSCNQIFLAEAEPRRIYKAAVTADPEIAIRRLIQQMMSALAWLAIAALVVELYHFRLLYFRPQPWVPFLIVLYVLAGLAVLALCNIGIQYTRMAVRLSVRRGEYDKMIETAVNQVMAIDDESHTMGISESPEPLRRRVERAIARVEALAGQLVTTTGSAGLRTHAGETAAAHENPAGEIIESLANKGNATPITEFLMAQRPDTTDTVGRNREIAVISYLHGDMATASVAVTAILLRLAHDQQAMTRRALVSFRNGDLEMAKKIFKRVIFLAREKKNELDLAAAYCNLGMLHLMLSEFDDADVRYSQAMQIYNRLSRDDGQADCLVALGLIAYRQKKKGVEVEDQFRRALAINNRRKRREGLSICCSLLGVILVEKEVPELKESEKLLNRAVHLNLELGRPGGVAAAYGNLGLVRVKRGDFAGAREQFLKAQSIYQRISRPKMMAKIQGMLKTVGELSAAKASRK
jgi:tetratricopeptide (TPR) repeat protein